jgi:prefoldin subunit 5
MTCKRPNRTVDNYIIYACYSLCSSVGKNCGAKTLRVSHLDAQVWGLVESYIRDPDSFIKKLLKNTDILNERVDALDESEETYKRSIEEIDEKVKTIWETQEANNWPMEWVAERLNKMQSQRERLQKKLDTIRAAKEELSLRRGNIDQAFAMYAELRAKLDTGLTFEEKLKAVRRVIDSGTVETIGTGRQKTAKITLNFKWDEVFALSAVASPKVSVDCFNRL